MKLKLIKSSLKGIIDAEPSKSYAHRFIIGASLTKGEVIIDNITLSEDIKATLKCIRNLGKDYRYENNSLTIFDSNDKGVIYDCKESGSTLRFFIPLSLVFNDHVFFRGSSKLLSRGIDGYDVIFKDNDIKIDIKDNNIILDGKFNNNVFRVDVSKSSQYLTGLLFALPLLPYDSNIIIDGNLQSVEYIDITLDVLSKFNIEIKKTKDGYFIKGNQHYIGTCFEVEGDYSNASFFAAFNYLGNDIIINKLKEDSLQGDKKYIEYFKLLSTSCPSLDISNCIDLGPVLFVFASIFNGATFTGTKRLILKESNRIEAIVNELSKINVKAKINEDEVIIYKSILKAPTTFFDSHNDHRIVMALSILSSLFDIEIDNYEAINKSYPDFFKMIEKLGGKVIYE